MRTEKELTDRYRAELASAKKEAASALEELRRCLRRDRGLRALAKAAKRAQHAAAAVYTAASCLILPP